MRAFLTTFACMLTITAGAAPPPFELTDTKGRKIEMTITGVSKERVTGIVNGKESKVPLEKLDPANLKELEAFTKKHGLLNIFPEFELGAKVRVSTPKVKFHSRNRHNHMTPEITVEAKTFDAVPAVEVVFLTVCMETRAFHRDKKRVYEVKGRSKMSFPATESGKPRTQDGEKISLIFDAERDIYNIGGWKYESWITFLRDPASGRILQFDTSFPALRNYLKENPEKVKEFANKQVDDTIPSRY